MHCLISCFSFKLTDLYTIYQLFVPLYIVRMLYGQPLPTEREAVDRYKSNQSKSTYAYTS